MASPTFVNAGTNAQQSFGASITPSLPASLVAGNVLLGVVHSAASASAKSFAWPSPWQVIDFHSSTDASTSVAFLVVAGGEGNPLITWTGNTSARAQIFQYTSALSANPIGAFSKNFNVGATADWTHPGLATSRPESLVAALFGGGTGGQTVPTPDDYTISGGGGGTGGQISAFHIDMTAQGTTTAISEDLTTNADFASFLIELVSIELESESESEVPSEVVTASESESEVPSEIVTASESESEVPSEVVTASESESESEITPPPPLPETDDPPPPVQCVVVVPG